jgi:hypothetical protein
MELERWNAWSKNPGSRSSETASGCSSFCASPSNSTRCAEPLIVTSEPLVHGVVGIVRCQVEGELETFRGVRLDGVFEAVTMDCEIGPLPAALVLVHLHLGLIGGGHSMELPRRIKGAVDDFLRHAVVGDEVETNFRARMMNLCGHGLECPLRVG